MPDAAIVIAMTPKIDSSYAHWCLERVAGKPVLVHLIDRLRQGLPVGEFEFHILCEDGRFAEKLCTALTTHAIPIFKTHTAGRLNLFSSFLSAHPSLKTVCLFDERAIFPDCRLTYTLLKEHRKKRSEATVAEGYPAGLLPDIYQASVFKRFQELGLPEELDVEFHSIMKKANDLFADDPSSQFKLLSVSASTFGQLPALKDLPAEMLVTDIRSQQSAERVLAQHPDTHFDSSEARYFKKELHSIYSTNTFSFTTKPCTPGKIPILFNTRFGGFTGAQECFFKIISHLDRNRFEPTVILPYEGVFSEKLRNAGIPVDIGGFPMNEISPWTLRYFNSLLRHTGARIVHIDSDPAAPLVLAAFQQKIPFVYHLTEFLGRSAPLLLQFADRVITISDAVRNDHLGSNADPNRVVTIFEGIDIQAFDSVRLDRAQLRIAASIAPTAKVITIVARIVPEKRIDMILSVLPEILKKFPEALLLIVGEHFPKSIDYRKRLEQLILQLKISDHVRFWGFEKNMAKIYAMSDVLVSCRSNEPVGHSILEALAMKVPVLVPNHGGHNEILRHNENATLYEADNNQSLAGELIRLLLNPSHGHQLAEAGRKTVEKLDLPIYMKKLEQVYEDILIEKVGYKNQNL